MSEYEEQIKYEKDVVSKFEKLGNAIKKHFTLLIIFVAIGICIGLYISKQVFNGKMDDAIKLGGLIHKNVVYDIKHRP